jgi:hypothetical protein
VITAQWFLTLFTYTFPVVPTVLQLWDYVFLTGWEGTDYTLQPLLSPVLPIAQTPASVDNLRW